MKTLFLRPRPSRTTLLALSGTLALGLGCGVFDPPGNGSAPPGREGQPAPVIRAAQEARIPDEYIVVFSEELAGAAVEAAADWVDQAGGANQVLHRYSVLSGFAAHLDEAALERLRQTRSVAYIEENQHVSINTQTPSPASGIDRVDQRVGRDGQYNDHGRQGAGVHLYVLDSGLNTQHTEFTGRVGGGYTTVPDGRGVEDCNGHGSHVSSTAAGAVYGMARQATLHPVRVLDCAGQGSYAGVIAGVDFVRNDCPRQNGPCVANMSLGGVASAALNQAVARAVDWGVTFVVAAGNENSDACTRSPAGEPKAITVAAIDDADRRAGFSNWGTCVDLFAPGVNILGASTGGAKATRSLSGTSMASPHVAAAAALYLNAYPKATPAQVEAGIKSAASISCVDDPAGSPNTLLFSDLSQGHYYCVDPAASCLGHCGGPSKGCQCDPGCDIYGDCCADFSQVCK